jgi:hypothetical protein
MNMIFFIFNPQSKSRAVSVGNGLDRSDIIAAPQAAAKGV